MEIGVIHLAIKNATDEDIQRIKSSVAAKAIKLIETHYDIQIEQHYQDIGEAADMKNKQKIKMKKEVGYEI